MPKVSDWTPEREEAAMRMLDDIAPEEAVFAGFVEDLIAARRELDAHCDDLCLRIAQAESERDEAIARTVAKDVLYKAACQRIDTLEALRRG